MKESYSISDTTLKLLSSQQKGSPLLPYICPEKATYFIESTSLGQVEGTAALPDNQMFRPKAVVEVMHTGLGFNWLRQFHSRKKNIF